MGTTPNGLPYPEGSDLVADGDDAIRALAQTLRIWSGSVDVDLTTNPTSYAPVVFPDGLFTSPPQVLCQLASHSWYAAPYDITAAGCTVAARSLLGSPGAGTRPVYVIACQINAGEGA